MLAYRRFTSSIIIIFSIFTANSYILADILFSEVPSSNGIEHISPSFGASWGDLNSDGFPDIWIGNHYSKPSLYLNNRDGTFSDVIDNFWAAEIRDVHGATWVDVDNDGDEDILEVSGGGISNHLWINHGNTFTDEAEIRGLGSSASGSRARTALPVDWNLDGAVDLIVAQYTGNGSQPVSFLNNSGIFSSSDLSTGVPLTSSAFVSLADLNGDKSLDLIFHAHSDFPSAVYDTSALPFSDLLGSVSFPAQSGSSVEDVLIADLDNDLDNDILFIRQSSNRELVVRNENLFEFKIPVVNTSLGVDFQTSGTLQINGYFVFGVDANDRVHIGDNNYSIFDFTYDLDLLTENFSVTLDPTDIRTHGIVGFSSGSDQGVFIGFDPITSTWSIHYSTPNVEVVNFQVSSSEAISNINTIGFSPTASQTTARYWEQTSPGTFVDKTNLKGFSLPLPCNSIVGADLDNDMDVDIYLNCANPVQNLNNRLFINDGSGSFTEVNSGDAVGSTLGRGESVASADYNQDGFIDLFITNGNGRAPFHNGPHQLFRNPGNGNHWIEIDLKGISSNSKGIGSTVILRNGNIQQIREQNAGIHKFSQNHQRLHFGTGSNDTVDEITVYWPSGNISYISQVSGDRVITIEENRAGYYLKKYAPTGSDILIDADQLTLKFKEITTPGFILIDPVSEIAKENTNISLISSTYGIESPISDASQFEICIKYNPSLIPNTQESETNIKIWRQTSSALIELTTTSLDVTNHIICADTNNYSHYFVGYKHQTDPSSSGSSTYLLACIFVFLLVIYHFSARRTP